MDNVITTVSTKEMNMGRLLTGQREENLRRMGWVCTSVKAGKNIPWSKESGSLLIGMGNTFTALCPTEDNPTVLKPKSGAYIITRMEGTVDDATEHQWDVLNEVLNFKAPHEWCQITGCSKRPL